MLAIYRTNRMGKLYSFLALGDMTHVETGKASIVINAPIDILLDGWYRWMLGDMKIQDAFPMLSAEEREFFMTGLTPEAFLALFPE